MDILKTTRDLGFEELDDGQWTTDYGPQTTDHRQRTMAGPQNIEGPLKTDNKKQDVVRNQN